MDITKRNFQSDVRHIKHVHELRVAQVKGHANIVRQHDVELAQLIESTAAPLQAVVDYIKTRME